MSRTTSGIISRGITCAIVCATGGTATCAVICATGGTAACAVICATCGTTTCTAIGIAACVFIRI